MMQKINIMNTIITAFVSTVVSASIMLGGQSLPRLTGGEVNTLSNERYIRGGYSVKYFPSEQITSCREFPQKASERKGPDQRHLGIAGVQGCDIHARVSVAF